ncbi:MAG TPA: FHA domain-containing protein [Pirellulales bacterium]|nr:FHA domain-containing protein [Pirellulales bacterium]
MKIRIRVRESPQKAFDWESADPSLTIGRADACQLVFRGEIAEIVSAEHLQVELSSQGAIVKDLDSTNGTYLNGSRLTAPAILRVGDHLQIGLAGPRLEVLSLDLEDAASAVKNSRPTRVSTPSTPWKLPPPWAVAAGVGAAAVVCLIALVVFSLRPADRSTAEAVSPSSSKSADATSSTENPVDTSGAGQNDGQQNSATDKSKPSTASSKQSSATTSDTVTPPAPDGDVGKVTGTPSQSASKADTRPSGKQASGRPPATDGVATLASNRDVLLRAVDDEWLRVGPASPVQSGERLTTLPTYRPSLILAGGVTLQLLDGAIVALDAPADDGGPRIHLFSGRILLLVAARPEGEIHLQAGDYNGTLAFGSNDALLAVEVRRLLPDGSDPERTAAPAAADLYLARGEATWADEQGGSQKLSGRSHRSLGDSSTAKQPDVLPGWISANALSPTERRASAEIEGLLQPDEPVDRALAELATGRKLEKRLLAVRGLALVESFDTLVPLLNDPKYSDVWTAEIESLRTAMDGSPQTATLLREALEKARGQELGDQLYRLLWGYTWQQLEEGAAAQLIDWLDAPDKQLDFRVLSFWNLHHMTGLGLNYQPAAPENQRRTAILRWKQKFESGLIVPKAA